MARTLQATAFHRGEIWLLQGEEGDDTLKPRPILIVSRDDMNRGDTVLGVPFYSQQITSRERKPYYVRFDQGTGGLSKTSVANGADIQAIYKDEIDWRKGPLGRASADKMDEVCEAISWVLRIAKPSTAPTPQASQP